MAVGDAAAQAGAPVVPQTDDARNGWNWINKLADWAALRWPLPLPVNKGGTGATSASAARDSLGIDRIQAAGGDHYLAIRDDGSVYGTDLFSRSYNGNSPSGSADGNNRIAVITPAGTLGALTNQVSNAYLPADLSPDTVNAAKLTTSELVATSKITSSGSKGTITSYGALHISSAGELGTVASAAKYKRDVHPAGLDVDALLKVEPVRFKLLHDDVEQLGFIADDFEPIAPELVIHGEDGQVEGLHYERVAVALYAIARAQQAHLDDLEKRYGKLAERLQTLGTYVAKRIPPEPAAPAEGVNLDG